MAERPDDGFEVYYAEKLWELLPGVHRHEDGLAEKPGVLRAMVELIAAQAATLRRSQDRLWDDVFIDLCDGWAIPYIGGLVGTRLVSALDPRGRRVDVAKTIYYRRRKGTVRVLEELAADITGWEGKVVESFRGLARTWHGLDPAARRRPGAVSATPAFGLADLRAPRGGATRVDGPWDELGHTADVRAPRGLRGRWNIPRLIFFLHRLTAFELDRVVPFARADGASFTFDPSGRDVPLFGPRLRGPAYAWDEWRSAAPWELPAPIPCRLLGHDEYEIEHALIAELADAGLPAAAALELAQLVGARFVGERRLRHRLGEMANAGDLLAPGIYDRILAGALVDECGKRALLPAALRVEPEPGAPPIAPEHIVAAQLADFSATGVLPGKELAVDPERGRFLFLLGAPPGPPAGVRVTYHAGLAGALGAGPSDRRAGLREADHVVAPAPPAGGVIAAGDLAPTAVTEVPDSATYVPGADAVGVEALQVQAANFTRPYLRLGAEWVFEAAPGIEATLVLDGLWIGAAAPSAVILRGAFAQVTLRSMTLDPGGEDVDGNPIAPVALVVAGTIDELTIERSIVASVSTAGPGAIDRLVVRDSVLDARGGTAIDLPLGEVHLHRVTVFGRIDVERLWASETLLTEVSDVTDTATGCFRFSAAPAGTRVPHRYRSHELVSAGHIFTSRRFGHPGYAQLAASAPVEIARGAEDGGEIGVWSALLGPIKLDSLMRKVEEFAPFGVAPAFVFET